jgi:hypothetical protein
MCHKLTDISASLLTDSKVHSLLQNVVLDASEACPCVSKMKNSFNW